jgi:hypothetical protein
MLLRRRLTLLLATGMTLVVMLAPVPPAFADVTVTTSGSAEFSTDCQNQPRGVSIVLFDRCVILQARHRALVNPPVVMSE